MSKGTFRGGRRYRFGRAAAWMLSWLGWLVMLGGLGAIGLGVFQILRLGTHDLLILAPYLGGGFVVFLNGLMMVAGAQVMLAVFDMALGRPARAKAMPSPVEGANPPVPSAPRSFGRTEPPLRPRMPPNGDED